MASSRAPGGIAGLSVGPAAGLDLTALCQPGLGAGQAPLGVGAPRAAVLTAGTGHEGQDDAGTPGPQRDRVHLLLGHTGPGLQDGAQLRVGGGREMVQDADVPQQAGQVINPVAGPRESTSSRLVTASPSMRTFAS